MAQDVEDASIKTAEEVAASLKKEGTAATVEKDKLLTIADSQVALSELKEQTRHLRKEKKEHLQKEVQRLKEAAATEEEKEKLERIEQKLLAPEEDLEKPKNAPPAKPRTGMDRFSDMVGSFMKKFEHFRNTIANVLAPILEQLSSIPFFDPNTINGILQFLGMHKPLIFSSMKDAGLEVDLHPDDPKHDSDALDAIGRMGDSLHAANKNYSAKTFYTEAAKAYAEQSAGKPVDLQEFAEFAEKEVLPDERKKMENMPKPAEPPAAPTAAPTSPEAPKPDVNIVDKGGNAVEIQNGTDKLDVKKLANGKVSIGGKTWELVKKQSIVFTTLNIPLAVNSLKVGGDQSLIFNVFGADRTLTKGEVSSMYATVKNNGTFSFEKDGSQLEFKPV